MATFLVGKGTSAGVGVAALTDLVHPLLLYFRLPILSAGGSLKSVQKYHRRVLVYGCVVSYVGGRYLT